MGAIANYSLAPKVTDLMAPRPYSGRTPEPDNALSNATGLDLSQNIPMIAIVDDDVVVRGALKSLMRSLGHDASTFGSAEEFLNSEQFSRTSCLITDLHMPGLSGLDLQERLIAQGHRFPIIFLTAYPDEGVRMRAMKAGAVGFLTKPCNHDHLLDCLAKALKAA